MELSAFDLSGKVALITGGAHGIGFSIAEGMARCGATICFNCSSQSSYEKGMAAYQAAGIEAHGYVADVTDWDAVSAMVDKIAAEVGPVDILVNNAGIIQRKPMLETSSEDFERVIKVHVVGAFNCSKAVLPAMPQDADQEHRLRVRPVQHPVQRHGPRLHRHPADRAPARAPA